MLDRQPKQREEGLGVHTWPGRFGKGSMLPNVVADADRFDGTEVPYCW